MKFLKLLALSMLTFSVVLAFASCNNDESSSSSMSQGTTQSQSSSVKEESSSSKKEESSSVKEESSSSKKEESSSVKEESSSSKKEESSSQQTPVAPPVSGEWQSTASQETQNKVNELLSTKHVLKYNEDGSFKVMIFADTHMNYTADAKLVQDVKDRIKLLVDRENPDLIIFTGDNTLYSKSNDALKANLDVIVGYIEEKQIPWCHVYGNHDHESAMSKILQQQVYESYEYCVSKEGPDLFGVGNYVLGVYNDDGSLGSVIYCLDSGTYPSNSKYGKYDYIKDDQIAWYKETSELLQEYNNGKKVPAIMAFHIPLIENRTAHENRDNKELVYEYDGSRNEAICSSEKDTTLYETALERGDVKAIVTGHDHVNDYMYNYRGIKLASSPNFSELSYTNANVQGARVFDLNASKIDDIPTYVSYIIERLNPDNFDALSKNVTVADFEKDMEFKTSGYDNNGLAGTATAVIAEGKGQNGSNALSIQRSSTGNFEVTFNFESQCKLGDNEYLVVWADFTNVEFRKACFGVVSSEGEKASYRVDDNDAKNPPLYYLADGSTQWQTLNHGWDGCFGNEQSCPIKGKKGLFAVKTSDIFQGTKAMNEKTLVFGFYFYGDVLSSSVNTEFYLDNIMFVEDYKSIGNN